LLLVCSYIEALRAWASRQAERITVEDDQEEVHRHCNFPHNSLCFVHSFLMVISFGMSCQNPFQDRKCEARHELAGYDPSSTAHDYVAASER